MFTKIFSAAVLSVLVIVSIAAYGLLSLNVLGYVLCAAFIAMLFIPFRLSALCTGILTFGTIIVWGVISLSGVYDKHAAFPEQRLLQYEPSLDMELFQKEASLAMEQTGNLVGKTEVALPATARDVAFLTDSQGFRGSRNAEAASVVLVGGGFVYGSANTQADTLGSVVKEQYDISARMLSAPGDLLGYAELIRRYANEPDNNVILFLAEETDFSLLTPRYVSPLRTLANRMQSTDMARYLQMRLKDSSRPAGAAVGYTLDGTPIAFTQTSVRAAVVPEIETGELFAEVLASLSDVVDAVVFIPSKYRVYSSQLDAGGGPLAISAAWNRVQAATGAAAIPAVDLTPALEAAAESYWREQGKLLYWADDTHWNRNGIEIAVQELHRQGIL